MDIKEKFIRDLIDELNNINEASLDVCYFVSVIDQNISKCKDFIDTISKYNYDINGYYKDHSEGYTVGKIRILIAKPDEEKASEYMVDSYYNYCYYIEFKYDARMWGYCECSPEHEGYNAEYNCCGCGCDWDAPAFSITKEYDLGLFTWDGQEKDYWEYEKQFKIKESVNGEEVIKLEKEQTKQRLRNEIAQLQERINSL